jgi:peptidyl-prolyl cis-trans isomerase SurA
LWRKAVRQRFAGLVSVSENDIDLALEAATRSGALRVLVSELVIPVPEGADGLEQLAFANELSLSISGEGEFAVAAQEYSAARTAADGGRLDWMPLSNLPGPLGATLLSLAPGEVSEPLVVPGAIVLFMLRDVAEDRSAPPVSVSVEWAEFLLPNDPVEIARVRAAVDVCYDLYGQAKDLPADRLTVTTLPASQIPADVALELSRLDPGESSVALTRGQFRRFLMLCKREEVREEPLTRSQIRERVVNSKVDGLTNAYLEELRSAAIIREP